MKKVLQKMKGGLQKMKGALSNREVLLSLTIVLSAVLVWLIIFALPGNFSCQKPVAPSDNQTVESAAPPENTTPAENAIQPSDNTTQPEETTVPEEVAPATPNIKVGNTSYFDYQTVKISMDGTEYEVRAGAEVQSDNTTLYKVWFPASSSGGVQFINSDNATYYGIHVFYTQGAYRAFLIEGKSSKLCQELNQKLVPVELKTGYTDYQEKTITLDGETHGISFGCETWASGAKLYKVKFLDAEKQYFIFTDFTGDEKNPEKITQIYGVRESKALLIEEDFHSNWYQLLEQLK